MIPVLYTDTDKIRAVLGADNKDLKDDQIINLDLAKGLRLDLASWLPTHTTLYTAGIDGGATDTQKDIADAIILYSSHYCALQLSPTLSVAIPNSIGDGKNLMNRFSTVDWDALTKSISAKASQYKTLLLNLTNTEPVQAHTYFSGVGLATDPVTTAG